MVAWGTPLCCLLTPNMFRVSTVKDLRICQGFIDTGGSAKLPPEYGRLSWRARAKPLKRLNTQIITTSK